MALILKAIKFVKDQLKNWFKEKAHYPFLASIFIFIYKIFGRRPWSLGYNVYKFKKIKEAVEFHLINFRKGKLPPGYGYALDERIVEYPWVFSRLKEKEKRILDAGGALNHWGILRLTCLRDRKVYISTLAYEGFCAVSPNTPSYIFEDLRNLNFKDEVFDAILCISTLEHIGMDNTFLYTSDETKKENSKYAYLDAIKKFKRVLKRAGTLYLTMPFGEYKDGKWFQVFNGEMVQKLIDQFLPSKNSIDYFKYENNQWQFSAEEHCKNGYVFDVHKERRNRNDFLASSQSVVCLELTK